MPKNEVFIFSSMPNLSFIKIKSNDWVVIKPNLVKESKENDDKKWQCVITSSNLIQQMCGYVCSQLKKGGRVTICDAPQTDSSFVLISERLGLYEIAADCQKKYGVKVEVVDLRKEEWKNQKGIITERRPLAGDPERTVSFNLGRDSLFYDFYGEGKYYGADYDSEIVNSHHSKEIQEYLLSATPIKADVFINMPKLKTHKKTGVTLNLKNLVGINADKNWLPHHTDGSPKDGGDQFPNQSVKQKLERVAVSNARKLALKCPVVGPFVAQRLRRAGTIAFGDGSKVIRSGNWYGNDTTWRMVLDLNRCLLYGNPDGTLRRQNPKRYYSLVDGIIGMEGSGPMQGDAVNSGVVIGGSDPVAVDIVAARVMGFDWRKIPMLREALNMKTLPISNINLSDIEVVSDRPGWNGRFTDIESRKFFNFRPHFGWAGHIEYEK